MALYSAKEAKWYRRNVERREHRFFLIVFFFSPFFLFSFSSLTPTSPPSSFFSSLSVLSRPNSPSLFLCGKKKKRKDRSASIINQDWFRPPPFKFVHHPSIHVILINGTTAPLLRSSLINPPPDPSLLHPPPLTYRPTKVDLITSRAARTRRRARVLNVRARAMRNGVSQMCRADQPAR